MPINRLINNADIEKVSEGLLSVKNNCFINKMLLSPTNSSIFFVILNITYFSFPSLTVDNVLIVAGNVYETPLSSFAYIFTTLPVFQSLV